jgi:hypothetical protein
MNEPEETGAQTGARASCPHPSESGQDAHAPLASESGQDAPAPLTGKPWWQSRTLLGVLILLLGTLANRYQLNLGDQQISDIVTQAFELIGTALTIWGRITATEKLRIKN